MKKNILSGLCMLVATLILSTSCTLINKTKRIIASESSHESNEVVDDEEPQMPGDRERVQSKVGTHAVYNAKDLLQGHIRSDWEIIDVMGKTPVGLETPTLRFEPKTGRVYGNNGCNTINAVYKYNPTNKSLSFSNLLTTMRACADDVTDAQVNAALNNTTQYTWENEGSNHYLTFLDKAGNTLMRLRHQEFDFLNGAWKVESIEGKKVNNADVQLVIDIDEMKIHGNTGCNILNGRLETNPQTVNSISFYSIGVTRRACPDQGETEKALLVALEEATFAKTVDADKVELLDSHHNPVIVLTRIK